MPDPTPPPNGQPSAKPAKAVPPAQSGVFDGLPAGFFDAAIEQTTPCGGCGVSLKTGAVICTSCGFNMQTGAALRTKVTSAAKESSPKRARTAKASGSSSWKGPILIVVVACVAVGVLVPVVQSPGSHRGMTAFLGIGAGLGLAVARFVLFQAWLER